MDGENSSDESNESFTETEQWAQEILERARTRSEGTFETEIFSIEENLSPQSDPLDEVPMKGTQEHEEDSFRESIVTLEEY